MARSKKVTKESPQWTKAKWKAFVNVYLAPQEKEFVKKNLVSTEGCMDFLRDMAESGYKVSWSYAPGEGVHTVSLTGQYAQGPNPGLTMSLRHREYEVAITALAWCAQEEGMHSDWAERFTTAGGDDW